MQFYLDVHTRRWFRQTSPGSAEQIQFPPEIRAGELLSLSVQLVTGDPIFSGASPLATNIYQAAAGSSAGFVVDNNFLWYHPVTLAEALTAGSAVTRIRISGAETVRPAGSVQIGADKVYFCAAAADGDDWILTTSDANFSPAPFTPTAAAAAGSSATLLEQPAIVGGSVTGNVATGQFSCTLDAGNSVYVDLLQSTKTGQQLPAAWLEFSLYLAGRPVIRETLEVVAGGSVTDGTPATLPVNIDWAAFDARYELKGESGGTTEIQVAKNFNPVCSPVFRDATYGTYCRLDDSYPTITFADNFVGATGLRLYCSSADASVTGEIALSVAIGGGTLEVVTSTLTAAAQWIEIPLDAMPDGAASITRTTGSASDTLKSGSTVISAIIQSIEVEYAADSE